MTNEYGFGAGKSWRIPPEKFFYKQQDLMEVM